MVIVEFYDHNVPMHNVVSALANAPERVIFVGGSGKQMQKALPRIQACLNASGILHTELEARTVPQRDLNQIIEVLDGIVTEYPDCSIDLTGGNELLCCAAGVIRERYKDTGLQFHQYNIRTGAVYDCDGDGSLPSVQVPPVSIAQYVALQQGGVYTAHNLASIQALWPDSAEYADDIDGMWCVAAEDPTDWNLQLAFINELRTLDTSEDPLELVASIGAIRSKLGSRYHSWNPARVLKPLYQGGYLTLYSRTETTFAIRFRDEAILACLDKAGTILELKTWLIATQAYDKDGNELFQDAATGVWLDWDGIDGSEGHDTENEVDVVLMHGLCPVFISCKNGKVTEDELYKLDTVAKKFGGSYAKKALIGADLEERLGGSWPAFHKRAQDMGIVLLPDATEWTDEVFTQKLRKILN